MASSRAPRCHLPPWVATISKTHALLQFSSPVPLLSCRQQHVIAPRHGLPSLTLPKQNSLFSPYSHSRPMGDDHRRRWVPLPQGLFDGAAAPAPTPLGTQSQWQWTASQLGPPAMSTQPQHSVPPRLFPDVYAASQQQHQRQLAVRPLLLPSSQLAPLTAAGHTQAAGSPRAAGYIPSSMAPGGSSLGGGLVYPHHPNAAAEDYSQPHWQARGSTQPPAAAAPRTAPPAAPLPALLSQQETDAWRRKVCGLLNTLHNDALATAEAMHRQTEETQRVWAVLAQQQQHQQQASPVAAAAVVRPKSPPAPARNGRAKHPTVVARIARRADSSHVIGGTLSPVTTTACTPEPEPKAARSKRRRSPSAARPTPWGPGSATYDDDDDSEDAGPEVDILAL